MGLSPDVALRTTALVFLLLSALLLWGLVRHVGGPATAAATLVLFLFRPFALLWSRGSLIEYLAAAGAIGWLWAGPLWRVALAQPVTVTCGQGGAVLPRTDGTVLLRFAADTPRTAKISLAGGYCDLPIRDYVLFPPRVGRTDHRGLPRRGDGDDRRRRQSSGGHAGYLTRGTSGHDASAVALRPPEQGGGQKLLSFVTRCAGRRKH